MRSFFSKLWQRWRETPADGMDPPTVFARRPIVVRETPHGRYVLPADYARDRVAAAIAAGEGVPPEVIKLVRDRIAPGDVVVDVGAGFGRLTALFSGLAGTAGQVLAFEADEYLCDVLQETLRCNGCGNTRIFHSAVADSDGVPAVLRPAALKSAPYDGQRVSWTAAAPGGHLQTQTIDALAIAAPVGFMHIDVNGGELQVLRGAAATLRRDSPAVAFRFDEAQALQFGNRFEAIEAFLHEINYAIVDRYGGRFCLALPAGARAARPRRAAVTAYPALNLPPLPAAAKRCKILQNRAEVDACTAWLKRHGYVTHASAVCKNWDLAHLLPTVGDGNFLDMGSSDSYILRNLALKRIRGELHGIDLRAPDFPVEGVTHQVGDLMRTPYADGHFSYISCLSVLEHAVDYDRFAAEVARLLAPGGRAFVTFDYWEPRVVPPVQLYGLDWRPLDAAMVRDFIVACARYGLALTGGMDSTTGEPLICWGYSSPHREVSYSFGMTEFRKASA